MFFKKHHNGIIFVYGYDGFEVMRRRLERGLSQRGLSALCGVSYRVTLNIEKNFRGIRLENIITIYDFLGIPLDEKIILQLSSVKD